MKKNWLKWALCLVLAVGMLTCVASADIESSDVYAETGTTITVDGGKLTVSTPGTADTQYVLLQVKTIAGLDDSSAQNLLNDAKTKKAAGTMPYQEPGTDSIIYIDQVASNGTVTFANFQPKTAATSLFLLGGGEDSPKIIGAMIGHGVTVSGTVTLKGAAATDTAATVELNGETKTVALTNGAGTYSFESVPDGAYTLKVSGTAGKYVAREYAITVAGAELTQDVTINPKGDTVQDGGVNMQDVNALYAHTQRGGTKLTGYALECGKVLGNSGATMQDVNALYAHTQRGGTKLW